MSQLSHPIDTLRVGDYAHSLTLDIEEFVSVPLEPYRSEMIAIRRDEQGSHPEAAAVLDLLIRGLRPGLVDSL